MGSTVAELLDKSVKRLLAGGLTSAREDAELLLATVLGRNRAFLLAHPECPVSDARRRRFLRWIERRADSCPIQYLRGLQEFYGRDFRVDEGVLIPRPETELLVEAALDLLKGTARPRVLEIGTGSGCIAVTLACERPEARVVATDISPEALGVARRNADRHGVAGRVLFLEGRTARAVEAGRRFHLVVSNPPYVAFGDPRVAPDVARWEPGAALFAGETGLEVHREILAETAPFLAAGGRLVLEIGENQREGVVRAAAERGWALAASLRDLARIERCLVFSRP